MTTWRHVDGGEVGREPKRWTVPRPGRDGKPLGVLTIQVVPAEAYDRLREENEMLRNQYEQIQEALDALQ